MEELQRKKEEAAQKKKDEIKKAADNQIKDKFKSPMEEGLKKASETIDLSKISEGQSKVKMENEGSRMLLEGFKFLNVKIHLLSDDLNKIYKKEKYQNYFDIGVLSMSSGDRMKDEENKNIWKNGAKVHIETCDQLVIFKKEQREEYRKKVEEVTAEAGWVKCKKTPYTHHMLYEVKK